MRVVRSRIDTIDSLLQLPVDNYAKSEIGAFHGRKIIEAIAFGCLIGLKQGFKHIPNDAIGQYNAETIFKSLYRKGLEILQSPSEIREATQAEKQHYNVRIVIDGIPERRITREELIKKYQRMHNWLHELNPYTKEGQNDFHQRHSEQLWIDLQQLSLFLQRHVISIKGEAFFCVLKDKIDGGTKVISLSKIGELPERIS